MHKTIYMLGYASDIAGAAKGSAKGPAVMQQSPCLAALNQMGIQLQWEGMIEPDNSLPSIPEKVSKACEALGLSVSKLVSEEKFFTVLGGDHSSAIGTWSGVAKEMKGPLGLIWIDAHMDSHTPETTPSGNIHGMPLACLLGYGDTSLVNLLSASPKLKPEHVCLIGVRSFEEGEAELLKKLNVRIFFMEEIHERGMHAVMAEALQIATKGTEGFGITIDIDSIDPKDAPGTGCVEENGIRGNDLCHALEHVAAHPALVGVEIVEFDPQRDKNHLTEKLIVEIMTAMTFGKTTV